jgi:hypothetical protein
MATPLLTATPGTPPTYNPSMADTFSWVPVEGAGRPLFARAVYLADGTGGSSEQFQTIINLLSTIADNTTSS